MCWEADWGQLLGGGWLPLRAMPAAAWNEAAFQGAPSGSASAQRQDQASVHPPGRPRPRWTSEGDARALGVGWLCSHGVPRPFPGHRCCLRLWRMSRAPDGQRWPPSLKVPSNDLALSGASYKEPLATSPSHRRGPWAGVAGEGTEPSSWPGEGAQGRSAPPGFPLPPQTTPSCPPPATTGSVWSMTSSGKQACFPPGDSLSRLEFSIVHRQQLP